MPWNGSGGFSRNNGTNTGTTVWQDDRDAGTKIRADNHDVHDQDIADGVQACVAKNGENAMTGALDMGANRITALADGVVVSDAATVRQVQDSGSLYGVESGSANAYAITLSPAPSAYVAGQVFAFLPGNSSTGPSTLNVNGLGLKDIQNKGTAISEAEMVAGVPTIVMYDGTQFQLINSAVVRMPYDSQKIKLGASFDMQLEFDGSHAYIYTSTGFMYLDARGINAETYIRAGDSSGVIRTIIQAKAAGITFRHGETDSIKMRLLTDGLESRGHFYPNANSHDLGKDLAANRWRNIFVNGSVRNGVGGTPSTSNFGFLSTSGGRLYSYENVTGTTAVGLIGGSAGQLYVRGDGDCENTNNSYGAISDARVKQDIAKATPQWEDIKRLRIRRYKLKESVSRDGTSAPSHIGIVAQEAEEDGMGGLVKTADDGMKSVKYSVLYMKAVGALQEAQLRIESLEGRNAALEARLAKIEANLSFATAR